MRSEFQDVFKDAYDHWIDDACSHRYNASKSLALQVWQHQQSKVDELQKQIDFLNAQLGIQIDRCKAFGQELTSSRNYGDELQKRVDASLIAFEKLKDEINELHGQCDLHLIKYLEEKAQVLEQALKGESNESST